MSTRTLKPDTNRIYFCTFTCYDWLPLFEITNFYDKIYNWFNILENHGNKITGYVLMPNHLHFLIYVGEKSPITNKLIANGKRFMAYDIVSRLKKQNEHSLLKQLEYGVPINERSKGKKHQVFQSSFDAKPCVSREFLLQKLYYLHRNPVSGKWSLVDDFTKYPHSSAAFYETGEHGLFRITHYMDLI